MTEGPYDDIGEELEREARRREETHVVIRAAERKNAQNVRRFGRAWTFVTAGYGLFLVGFAAYMASRGFPSMGAMLLTWAAIMAVATWFQHRIHYRAQLPSLLLTPEGLTVHAFPRLGPIPWDEIEDITSRPFLLFPTLRLQVRDYGALRARLSPRDRRLLWMYRLPGRALGLNGVLYGDPEALRTLRRYWLYYGQGAAESPVTSGALPAAATAQTAPTVEAAPATVVETTPAAAEPPRQVIAGRTWWRE